jgi:LytS/YehU family sensor histidine kinase
VQWQLHRWLAMRTSREVFGDPRDVIIMQPVVVFFEYLIWGSIIVFIYVNRRTGLLAAAHMNAAQLDRAQTQRRTLASKLQALQARIEPQFLFNALARVRDLYDESPARGRRMLDDLSVYLRAVLPHLRDSTSTLEKEFQLLLAYIGILRGHHAKSVDLHVDGVASLLTARVPAMILLPLIDQVVAGAEPTSFKGSPVHLCVRLDKGMLHIEMSGGGTRLWQPSGDSVRDIRQRLTALYGERGTLTVTLLDGSAFRLEIKIPYEQADSAYR